VNESCGADPIGRSAVVGERVTLSYGSRAAIKDTSFAFPAGAVTTLVGPNGSGKSTLLHATAGLIPPRPGSLTVLGRPAESGRTRVRYVPQVSHVNERLPVTVKEVVTMARYAGRGLLGRLGRGDRTAVSDALERLALSDLSTRHLRELSGGERQRVAVAQGLAQDGELLLLDEPVTGLDLPSAARIRAVIAEERSAGRTVVFSTHDLAEAASGDHVVLLAGRVVAAGVPSDVLTTANLSAAYGGALLRTADGALLVDQHHSHQPTGDRPG